MNVSDRIKRAHIAIMNHKTWCAFSGILACGRVEVTLDVPTAMTDGWNVHYNPQFVETYAKHDKHLRFLVLHEATHKAYRHMHVWKSLHEENPRLANIAADHFVNLSLELTDNGEGFIEMLDCGVKPDHKYKGWSVRMIFDDLKKQPPQDDGDGGGDDGAGLDDHKWGDAGGATEEQQAERAREIERAIRQGEMLRKRRAGKGSADSDAPFGDLLQPEVDWRRVLREFVQETCQGRDESTWRRPHRRYLADDIYMPSSISEKMNELAVLFDTSGSIFGGDEMTRFVSEFTSIVESVRPAKTHVLYVDTEVTGHQVFEDGQFAVHDLKPKGGGGTDLPAGFTYLGEKFITPQAMVILTDGYTPFGRPPPYPVLWVCTTPSITAPWGTTIHLKD